MLNRLWRYCNKIFKLNEHLQELENKGFTKKNNEPFITAILFIAMFMRFKSFNVLEKHMSRNTKVWEKLLDTNYLPSIDTISIKTENSDIDGLRRMNKIFIHKLRRNKVFNINEASNGLMVAGIDGHETFCSEKRCCDDCKTRTKTVNGEEVIEYYHSYVVCQLLLCSIPVIIDIEPIGSDEGELTAAKRLVRRILKEQPRMVDVFCFDALYLGSPLLNLLETKNKYWITVIKQKNRDAYKEIDKLLPNVKKTKTKINNRDVCLYDMPELVGWDKLDKSFRAVVSDEKWMEWKRISKKKKIEITKTSHWRWLTNMPEVYKADIIYRFGHARWDVENRGFNDLANNINFDHPYHHNPVSLMAILWIISITFNLSYSFYEKNLKPEIKKKLIQDRSQLAFAMIETFVLLNDVIFNTSTTIGKPP